MPNQHHPDKEVLGFYLDRKLAGKIRRLARLTKQPITQLLIEILSHATNDISLTKQDLAEIAERKSRKFQRQNTGATPRKTAKKRSAE